MDYNVQITEEDHCRHNLSQNHRCHQKYFESPAPLHAKALWSSPEILIVEAVVLVWASTTSRPVDIMVIVVIVVLVIMVLVIIVLIIIVNRGTDHHKS